MAPSAGLSVSPSGTPLGPAGSRDPIATRPANYAAEVGVRADRTQKERRVSTVAPSTSPTGRGSSERTRIAGSLYRGREGMWSWVAHRISGVLTFFFLFAHVLDTALVRVSPESYDRVIDTYKNPFVNLMEIGLVGAVLFHALNGLRIVAVDFWARGTRYQRKMLWAIVLIWVVVMVPGAFFMFKHSFEQLFGSGS